MEKGLYGRDSNPTFGAILGLVCRYGDSFY